MRLQKHKIRVTSGCVLICDPLVVGDDGSTRLEDGARFRCWEGSGDFAAYTDGECYFVDIDPRILKAGTRPNLTKIAGHVGIDTAMVGIYDLTQDREAAADDAIADQWAIVVRDLEPCEYVAWLEEKGTSKELFRGVIGFGKQVKMLLNSSTGEILQELEERIARTYRLKGAQKQSEFQDIQSILAELHLSGCKDPRLHMLADAAKFKLPRRSSKRQK